MLRKLLGLAAVAAGLADTGSVTASPALSLPIERHRLANGMRVVLAPDASLEDVTVVVRYGVGTADDPAYREGLAHIVEHLMFAGSRHAPSGYHRYIERTGGWNENATTSLDETNYFVTVPPEELPVVLWLESDRMGFAAERIDAAAVRKEAALVADEMRERVDDRVMGAAWETTLGEVFPEWHPYHREFTADSLGAFTVQDVRAFLGTWYTPKNATLVVAGRFEPAAVLALATRYFADLPAYDPPIRPAVPEARRGDDVEVTMRASVLRPYVSVMWPAPAFEQPGDRELDVAAAILSEPSGRLQRELVATGLASSVHAQEGTLARGSVFSVGAYVAADRSPEDVVAVLERMVRDLAARVGGEECARARDQWGDTMVMRLETSAGRAHHLGREAEWGLASYAGIQPAGVEGALRALLARRETVVVVQPDARAPLRGRVVERRPRTR